MSRTRTINPPHTAEYLLNSEITYNINSFSSLRQLPRCYSDSGRQSRRHFEYCITIDFLLKWRHGEVRCTEGKESKQSGERAWRSTGTVACPGPLRVVGKMNVDCIPIDDDDDDA